MGSYREATPPIYDPDDDLYGLSPGGEISLARIQAEILDDTSRSKITTAPASALRVRSTPAAEASILALANFKRRPRQPSIIRQVQLASETGDRYDFDDLEPEDESTPLHLNKRRTRSSLNSQHENSAAPATSSSRKRKFSEVQVAATQPSPLLASSPPPSPRPASTPGLSRSSSPALPSRAAALPARPPSPTLADPLSSSSAAPSIRASKRRRPSRAPAAAAAAAPPKTRLAAKARAAAVSTAALQSLLPKPRRRGRARAASPFAVPSDGDGDAAAERETPVKGKGAGGGVEALRARRTYGRRGGSDKENESDARLEESEDGGDDDDDDGVGWAPRRARSRTVEMSDAVLSKQMQNARKKFREVDEWEMEFESVDLGVSGSSWR